MYHPPWVVAILFNGPESCECGGVPTVIFGRLEYPRLVNIQGEVPVRDPASPLYGVTDRPSAFRP